MENNVKKTLQLRLETYKLSDQIKLLNEKFFNLERELIFEGGKLTPEERDFISSIIKRYDETVKWKYVCNGNYSAEFNSYVECLEAYLNSDLEF